MSGGWLWWERGRLRLSSDGQGYGVPDLEVPTEQLAGIGFGVDRYWELAVPGPAGPRFWWSRDGAGWRELPAPPRGFSSEAAYGLVPRLGGLFIVEPGWLQVKRVDEDWATLPLPDGAIWAGLGADGALWAVGSRPAVRVRNAPREAAAWHRERGAESWKAVELRAPWWDAYRAIQGGGFEQLRAVDATAHPVVLGSECAWFLEDPSWFLFVARADGRWTIQRLPNRALAHLERTPEGRPLALTADGELWDWNGQKWIPRGAASALEKALSAWGATGRRSIFSVVDGASVYGLAVLFADDGSRRERAVKSEDGGRTWHERTLGEDPECRVLAAWRCPGGYS